MAAVRTASASAEERAQHWLGIMLTAASAIAYSTAGFFTRLIHLDVWTILFWRGLFAGLFIAGFIVWQQRRRTLAAVRAIGAPGLVAACLSAIATIMIINAFRRTSVADVMIIVATVPFMTAALGWLWLREREGWTTLLASTVALFGAIVMVGGAVTQGHLFGDLLAFGMALCMAIMMLIIHFRYPLLWLAVKPIDYHKAGMMVLYVSLVMSVFSGLQYVWNFIGVLAREPAQETRTPSQSPS